MSPGNAGNRDHSYWVGSLRVWLPLVLSLVFGLVFVVLMVVEYRNHERALERFVEAQSRPELLGVQRQLENALRRGEGGSTDSIVSELGLNPAVNHAALVDDADKVIAATQFAWRGRSVAQVLDRFPEREMAVARQQSSELLWFDKGADGVRRLMAVAPVTLGLLPGEIRSYRTGVLLIEYDLAPIAAEAVAPFRQQSLLFGLVALLALVVLGIILRTHVYRPVMALCEGMAQVGKGAFQRIPRFRGGGEFKVLADALTAMAESLKRKVDELADSEARFRQLSDASFEAILIHQDGVIVDANRAAEALYESDPGGLVGRDIYELVAPEQRELVRRRAQEGLEGAWEIEFVSPSGVRIPAEIKVKQSRADSVLRRIVAIRDIRERLQAQDEIRRLAYFDALTGLPNRRQFLERVRAELDEVDRLNHRAAVLTFNLDGFSSVNDSLGMAAGDEVLRTIARRLNILRHENDLVARIDGDTFAILLADLAGDLEAASAEAAREAERFIESIMAPVEVGGTDLHFKAGAGVVMIPNDSRDPPELLREAETAMNRAKEANDSRVHFFAHALQEAAGARLALRNDLTRSLKQGEELLLHYQPQVDAQGRMLGMEALVRWQHPVRGLIPPGLFIPEAEASGLIVPLGNWVLEEAVRCLKRWQEMGLAKGLTMGVNVSPRQFREGDFIHRLEDVLARVGVDALSIELELTESVVADDLDATVETMRALRERGIRFALDDFGTGYSSLAYLRRLPFETLKIDRSFVMDIGVGPVEGEGKSPAVLIDAIVAMAHELDLRVLAEGVETQGQIDYLVEAGCDVFQGYFFGKPAPAEQIEARLRAARGEVAGA